ncbi:quinon protein alcohol dehydrogenase-like superfamily [Suillus americanus]|nr:quinon protein alcohol dehydrogenase-like superfamily [Suillus americanus]
MTARWNLESGKQIGEDWRDGESEVRSIALSPDGKTVASGSDDGAVRLWDIDTRKVITTWTGHTKPAMSVCWSRDGWRVLSGSKDGTARQWDVERGETTLEPIVTGHIGVIAVVYSPDATLIATGGQDGSWTHGEPLPTQMESSVQIRDTKTFALARQRQKQKMKSLPTKNFTAGSSQPLKPNVTNPSSQPQSSFPITPADGDVTAATASTPSRPDAMIRQAGLWTRFWLFLGCLSPEYTDDHQ